MVSLHINHIIITRDNFFFFCPFPFFPPRRQKKKQDHQDQSRRLLVSVQKPERNFLGIKREQSRRFLSFWQWILWRIEHCLRSLFLEIAGNNFLDCFKQFLDLSLVLDNHTNRGKFKNLSCLCFLFIGSESLFILAG